MPPDIAITADVLLAADEPPRRRPLVVTIERLLHHRQFTIGLALFAVFALAAVLAPVIAPGDPNRLAMSQTFQPPSWAHPFGTDNFGR
ncbi:MAG: hypothetical protein ACREF3_08175, partial [Acetobacteraceae bacterium]